MFYIRGADYAAGLFTDNKMCSEGARAKDVT